jgi:hypothetical protein
MPQQRPGSAFLERFLKRGMLSRELHDQLSTS